MSNILNSEDFGLKIYNRFPPKYREDDASHDYALMRYLQALADGGFKYSIDEINGIHSLVDPQNADAKVLSILFKQYGLELFNGIPEQYLRYILPRLGEAWSKKGSLSVVEFITSSLTGVKTSTEVEYDDFDNPTINVRLEMDYTLDGYLPESSQFTRLLKYFIPFYCDLVLMYSYLFNESQVLNCKDSESTDVIIHSAPIQYVEGELSLTQSSEEELRRSALVGEAVFGISVFGSKPKYRDTINDCVVYTNTDPMNIKEKYVGSLTNNSKYTLNEAFYTNRFTGCDIITKNGTKEYVFND